MLKTILLIVAVILFGLDAFRVPGPINWTPAAFGVLVVALFLV